MVLMKQLDSRSWQVMRLIGPRPIGPGELARFQLAGIVERVGCFYIASPAFHDVIGEPMIGGPVPAFFNTADEAAGVLE